MVINLVTNGVRYNRAGGWVEIGAKDSGPADIYVPLTAADESRLMLAEPSDLLRGLVFRSREPRYVTVGVASDYRLVFEREWHLPENTDPQTLLADVLGFLLDAPGIALSEDMPPARRQIVSTTSEAIQELATATS